jgi:hypothetical protein
MKTLRKKKKIKKSKKLNQSMKHSWMFQVFFLIQYYNSKDKIQKNKNQDFSMILTMKATKNQLKLKLSLKMNK